MLPHMFAGPWGLPAPASLDCLRVFVLWSALGGRQSCTLRFSNCSVSFSQIGPPRCGKDAGRFGLRPPAPLCHHLPFQTVVKTFRLEKTFKVIESNLQPTESHHNFRALVGLLGKGWGHGWGQAGW